MNDSILIIGNGPSTKALADFGFNNLPDSIDTFAMGAAYRHFERINWWPDYYAWCDVKVVHSHRDSFRRLIEDPKVTTRQFYFPLPVSNASRLEIVPHSSTGDFCFEKAVSLGYKTIYLIGIEGNYVEAIDGSRPMTDDEFDAVNMRDVFDVYASIYKSREQAESNFRNNLRIIAKDITDNPNYFFPDYQRKGDVFSAPRSHTHRSNWKNRAERLKESNVTVYNLSESSLINNFIKKNFYEAMQSLKEKEAAAESNLRALSINHRPLVSIIIPIYNVELYIQDCLNSVKSQTYDNIEIVIVNDGSTDRSGELARDITKEWKNIKFINQQNLGLGGARNTGVMHASGEYIVFLDSDDMIKDDHISSFIDVILLNPNIDIVTGGCELIDERGHEIGKSINTFNRYQTEFGVELSEADQILGLYASSIACARLYRAALLKSPDLTFPNHLPHEDWFFTYKAFYKARRTASTPSITYLYRIRENSLSKSISIKYADTIQNIFEDTFKFINENDFSPIVWELFSRRIVIVINSLFSRIKKSDSETRAKFANLFKNNYAIIVSSYARLNSGPLRKHWIPKQFVEFIDNEIQYLKSSISSHKNAALAAPEFYFAPPSEKISKLKNKFKGKRCFIIGNGPSLNRHDLSLLEGEYTFAVNSFFYKSDETGFMPTFYMVEDSKVVEERSKEINSYPYPYKIFPSIFKDRYIKDNFNVAYINMDQGFYKTGGPFYCVPRFSKDAADAVIAGQTVTYANMQLAYYMGFTEVHLIGMDFHYIIPAEHKISGNHILSTTDDPNHFHKDYFGVGKTWKDPKLDRVAMNYRQAKLAYEAVGRKIYNATIGGKLEIFDRVDYDALLRDPETGAKRQQRVPPVITRRGEGPDGQSLITAASPGNPDNPGNKTGERVLPTITSNLAPAQPAKGGAASNFTLSTPQPPIRRPFYAPFGDAVRTLAPALFPVLQTARRALWRLGGSPLVWIAALGALGVIGVAAFAPGLLASRLVLAGAALGGIVVLGLGALGWRLRRAIQTLSAENRRLAADIAHIHELAAGREGRVDRLVNDQRDVSGRLVQYAGAQTRSAEATLRAELSGLEARLADTNLANAGALRDELASLQAALDQKLKDRAASTTASFGRAAQAAKRREAELQDQIDALQTMLLKAEGETASTRAAVSEAEAALREELKGLQQAIKTAEEAAASARETAIAADGALRDELGAVRQGLEQRLRAEVDEATAESVGRLTERVQAVAMTTGESDANLRQEIETLRTQVDSDIKVPLEALTTTSKQALDIATGTQKAVSTFQKTGTMLQERVASAERQIGAIKYPDAPDVFVFFGHHKCGSRFFRNEVFGRIAESTGARVRKYHIANPPHHYSRLDDLDLPNIDFSGLGENGRDVVLFANATQRSLDKIRRTAEDWRGLRIIRDPRQVLISNYFHHKGDHPYEASGWVWDQLKHDKPILNELLKEDGILYELDNISRHVIEDLVLAPFDDERVLTLRLEDFGAEPAKHLEQIASFLKVPDVAGIDLGATRANSESSSWPQNFTSKIREVFKDRYGQALIDLGYEEDMDW